MPPFIGPSVIHDQAMEQYGELIAEMLKLQSANALKLGASGAPLAQPER